MLTWHLSPLVELFAASRISCATSFGCDKGDAWLDVSEIVVALICFANIRSTSGGIAWSFSEIWYQLGSCFQAGGPDFSARIDLLNGFCAAAMTLARLNQHLEQMPGGNILGLR